MDYNCKLSNFVNEFENILKKDIYINKQIIDNIFDKNKILLNLEKIEGRVDKNLYNKSVKIVNDGYRIVELHNKNFIERKLIEYKDYFDNMFKSFDSNIILDDEQRRAILTDEDYSLVIAGAGSGKTTTMAAKVKYLVDKCSVNPEKIILLAFTNKAALELSERINHDFKINVEVLTFHKLGMKFLRNMFNKPLKIASEYRMRELIQKYIEKKVFSDKEMLKKFITYFDKYVHFNDDVLDYNSFDEYFRSYVGKIYLKNKENLDEYNNKIIKQRLDNLMTINGEFVKSRPECEIANYLFENGYTYEYEKMYPYKVDDNRSYSPDFTVHAPGYDFYIEYYGLSKYEQNGRVSIDDVSLYNKLIEKKRELHKKYKTYLIELYSEYEDKTDYLSELKNEIKKQNINTIKRTDKDIFYRLMNTSKTIQYFKFIDIVCTFINRFKNSGYDKNDFDELLSKEVDEKTILQLKFIKPIYEYYDKTIHRNMEVDFNDMINYAYKSVRRVKEKNSFLEYNYLIIDEYQDISMQRYNFIKELSDIFSSKIVAVGDDWQAIYGFSGSDVDLFTNFNFLMGYSEILKITKIYRNSQELVDVAGEFVSKNTQQFQKKLQSIKHLNKPIKIVYYSTLLENDKKETVISIIQRIIKNDKKGNILILGRYNEDIEFLIDNKIFRKGTNDSIVYIPNSNVKIDFLTIHSSKGLGYDNVILINAINGSHGFPSKIKDEPIIDVLNKQSKEKIEYPEERRLFYVALTRTKNSIYILTPLAPYSKRSSFVNEIISNKNVGELY